MKNFVIGLALITTGLAPQIAAASCVISGGKVANTGAQACRGSSTSSMTVQTCASNGAWQSSGTKCTCNGGDWVEYSGQYTCSNGYTVTSTSTGATQAKK